MVPIYDELLVDYDSGLFEHSSFFPHVLYHELVELSDCLPLFACPFQRRSEVHCYNKIFTPPPVLL